MTLGGRGRDDRRRRGPGSPRSWRRSRSRSRARRSGAVRCVATRPLLAVRSAPRLAAPLAAPLMRRISTASSKSPSASSSAFLQSIMPAPVRSRSFLTSAAVKFAIVVTLSCSVVHGWLADASGAAALPSAQPDVPVGRGSAASACAASAARRQRQPRPQPRPRASATASARPRRRPRRPASAAVSAGASAPASSSRSHSASGSSTATSPSVVGAGAAGAGHEALGDGVGDDAGEQARRSGSRRRCPGSGSRPRRGRSWCRGSRRPGCRACAPRRRRCAPSWCRRSRRALGTFVMSRIPPRVLCELVLLALRGRGAPSS